MIKNMEPISMSESVAYIDKEVEKAGEIRNFIKGFVSLKSDDAKKLRERLENLKLLKMNKMHIAKVVDLLPDNMEDLNKIFVDVTLDEDESKKITDVIKEFK